MENIQAPSDTATLLRDAVTKAHARRDARMQRLKDLATHLLVIPPFVVMWFSFWVLSGTKVDLWWHFPMFITASSLFMGTTWLAIYKLVCPK